jgi:hypothetical protein
VRGSGPLGRAAALSDESWGRWDGERNFWKGISGHPPSCTRNSAGLGPSNAPLASLALSGRWGRRLDRPPRRGVASDSEIRRATSFIWALVSCSLALRCSGATQDRQPTHSPQYRPRRPVPPNSAHQAHQARQRHAAAFAASCNFSGSHTPKPQHAQSYPAPSGVGLDQPSFASRITLNESLFSTSLRSLGGPTTTPVLTPPKTSRCGPSVRQSDLSSLAPTSTNTPSTAKASQKPVSGQIQLTFASTSDCGRPWHAWHWSPKKSPPVVLSATLEADKHLACRRKELP